ncbi:dienelactone hydrolase family protein [Dyella solisilvae]|uniref:Dienelactone hydrolase family protein n=1 Tax=Dyella solisilvae TaxID=1920168 RepID=A0A370KDU5_9GAMM|nr:dienelactone hydrolase family protein [Dyella solisilvae]RDJ00271.1 dienelactone hydrolase family protein [Dyella solisilvae]
MARTDLTIPTRDGHCPASLFTPAQAEGPWPGVVFFMDALGMRAAMHDMAQRLADDGYAVLLPDIFYRLGPYPPMVPAEVFSDAAQKEDLMRRIGTLDRDRKLSDAEAFMDFLAARPEAQGRPLGATGYCMGGSIALTAACAFPQRLAAIASFHAGGLATDQPDSPHRHVKGITGTVYVAGADDDIHFTVEQKDDLERALVEAGVAHTVLIYAGAHHGFAVPDHPAFNAEAAERHWQALAELFGRTLASH